MTAKATRHTKTPAQRAQEQVDILQRRLTKIETQKIALEHQTDDITLQFDVTQKRLTYALSNPDLPPIKPPLPPRVIKDNPQA
jgi:hypothetical protein